MTISRTLPLALVLTLAACASSETEEFTWEPSSAAPRQMHADASVEDLNEEQDWLTADAAPWGDLEWEVVEDGVLVRLAGEDQDHREARSRFLSMMLLRRTHGLGRLEAEARNLENASGSEVRLSGEEVPLLAARRLLQGLKESRDILKWEFSLVRVDSGQELYGPFGLIVLAGQRASLSVTDQIAYVSDFEVEVSSASVIADPIIDVINEGLSLDILSFADPDGRVEASIQLTAVALKRPIREAPTNLGHGEDVTVQVPELETSTPRLEVQVPMGRSTFNMGPVEIPVTNDEGEIETVAVRLQGRVIRRER